METGAKFDPSAETEDALSYLPRKPLTSVRKGQRVFDEQHPSPGLHLVVRGRVKLSIPVDTGSESIVDIFGTDDFFGESALLGVPRYCERATAIDNSTLMSWTSREIEDQSEKQPKLGVALVQMLVKRGEEYQARLQSMALEKTPERVARAMLRFAERFGIPTSDGALQIPPLTHQLISEYVGTSREIVTYQMNRLRNKGVLRYSRTGIQVYPDALKTCIQPGIVTSANKPLIPKF
jgi:CRP/FNR family transcriptional regulator